MGLPSSTVPAFTSHTSRDIVWVNVALFVCILVSFIFQQLQRHPYGVINIFSHYDYIVRRVIKWISAIIPKVRHLTDFGCSFLSWAGLLVKIGKFWFWRPIWVKQGQFALCRHSLCKLVWRVLTFFWLKTDHRQAKMMHTDILGLILTTEYKKDDQMFIFTCN